MKFKTYWLCALITFAGMTGCSKDDKNGLGGGPTGANCATAWATEYQNELDAITAALTAYGNNQSTANCNALKAAYQDYIDAIKPYGACTTLTGQQRDDWEQALAEAEANVDDIC